MAFDEKLAERVRAGLAGYDRIEEKRLMGGQCWMWNGNLLCTVGKDHCLFRVGREAEAAALGMPGAGIMKMGARTMHGWVRVQAAHTKGPALKKWIALAAKFVGTLPAK